MLAIPGRLPPAAPVARLLPELLSGRPHLPRPEPLTEGWQRQRLFEALARAIFTVAGRQPLLLVIDDLQWTDQETLEWLRYLLRFNVPARLLIIGTARSEEVGSDHPLKRLTECCPKFTAGSQRALKRLIYRKLGCCWQN